jgi:hypothetical protein
MIFLIEYNPRENRTIQFREFSDSERAIAGEARLALELDLRHKGIDHEVVTLEAARKDILRRTHQRYFGYEVLNQFTLEDCCSPAV